MRKTNSLEAESFVNVAVLEYSQSTLFSAQLEHVGLKPSHFVRQVSSVAKRIGLCAKVDPAQHFYIAAILMRQVNIHVTFAAYNLRKRQ